MSSLRCPERALKVAPKPRFRHDFRWFSMVSHRFKPVSYGFHGLFGSFHACVKRFYFGHRLLC